jgi:hypothetical protein
MRRVTSDEEWDLLKVIAQILSVFEGDTQPLCAVNYPTLNMAVPAYNDLFDDLEGFLGMRNDEDEDDGREKAALIDQCSPANKRALKAAIWEAHSKLRGYYAEMRAGMYAIAVILDPTLKMDYYKVTNWEPDQVAAAKRALLHAVEVYGAAAPPPPSSSSDHVDIAVPSCRGHKRLRVRREVREDQMRQLLVQADSEVDRYLAERRVDGGDTGVLEWWKQNSKRYPCLARIARDYLAIQATSTPAERVFSSAANLIDDKRGSLEDDTIQACMCLKSWLLL